MLWQKKFERNLFNLILYYLFMKFYLSSYRLGNEIQKLKKLLPKNKRVALVTNAADAYSDTKLTKTK